MVVAIAQARHTTGTHLAVAAESAMNDLSENRIAQWTPLTERIIKREDVLQVRDGEEMMIQRIEFPERSRRRRTIPSRRRSKFAA